MVERQAKFAVILAAAAISWASPTSAQGGASKYNYWRGEACGNDPRAACEAAFRRLCGKSPNAGCVSRNQKAFDRASRGR